jgi:hypothetical protein
MARKPKGKQPKPKRDGTAPPLKVGDQRAGESPGAFSGSEPKGSRYQPQGKKTSGTIKARGSATVVKKKPTKKGPISIGKWNPLYKITQTLGGKK